MNSVQHSKHNHVESLTGPSQYPCKSVAQALLLHPLHKWKNGGSVKSNALLETGVSEWRTSLWHWSTTISRFWQATTTPFAHLHVQSFQEVPEFPVDQLHPGPLLRFLEKLVLSRFFFLNFVNCFHYISVEYLAFRKVRYSILPITRCLFDSFLATHAFDSFLNLWKQTLEIQTARLTLWLLLYTELSSNIG